MDKRVNIKSVNADAGFCYTWSRTPNEERRLLCLLADISSEAVYCRWHQLQSFERVALRAAIASVIEDHYQRAWERAAKETRPPAEDMLSPGAVAEGKEAAIGPPPSAEVS